ncbi:MAG: DUF3466 family protein [Planctomycetes bacterium]|nr:DUF3466 family protein [Planctomycetota bacterium]
MKQVANLCTTFCLICMVAPTHAQQLEYAILELAKDGLGHCINEQSVCGGYVDFETQSNWPGIWTWEQGLNQLPLGDAKGGSANDINNNNQIVGYYWPETPYVGRAYLYEQGVLTDLGTFGGDRSSARAISDSGVVVGSALDADGYGHWLPFAYEGGVMRELDTPIKRGGAHDVNNQGIVVGYSYPNEYRQRACLWTPDGRLHWLTGLNGNGAVARGINDNNVIVGSSFSDGYSTGHAVVWLNGKVHDIHSADNWPDSAAYAINSCGQVVGRKSNDGIETVAFIYERGHGMRLADVLLPPRSRWRLSTADDINDHGQIVGAATPHTDRFDFSMYLLTPVYPSFDLTQFSPGIPGQMSTIEAHNVPPGATVHFLGARWGGGTLIPTCEVTKNALQLEDPRQLGTAVADSNGVATIQGVIPEKWAGREILFQAFVRETCEISNLVVQTFE